MHAAPRRPRWPNSPGSRREPPGDRALGPHRRGRGRQRWPHAPGHAGARAVCARTHNSYLETALTQYHDLATRIWSLVIDRLPGVTCHIGEHGALLTAIVAGEPARARELAAAPHRQIRARGPRRSLTLRLHDDRGHDAACLRRTRAPAAYA